MQVHGPLDEPVDLGLVPVLGQFGLVVPGGKRHWHWCAFLFTRSPHLAVRPMLVWAGPAATGGPMLSARAGRRAAVTSRLWRRRRRPYLPGRPGGMSPREATG